MRRRARKNQNRFLFCTGCKLQNYINQLRCRQTNHQSCPDTPFEKLKTVYSPTILAFIRRMFFGPHCTGGVSEPVGDLPEERRREGRQPNHYPRTDHGSVRERSRRLTIEEQHAETFQYTLNCACRPPRRIPPSQVRQFIDMLRNFPRDAHQCGNELFINIHVTFIFSQVALAMSLIQDAPLLDAARRHPVGEDPNAAGTGTLLPPTARPSVYQCAPDYRVWGGSCSPPIRIK